MKLTRRGGALVIAASLIWSMSLLPAKAAPKPDDALGVAESDALGLDAARQLVADQLEGKLPDAARSLIAESSTSDEAFEISGGQIGSGTFSDTDISERSKRGVVYEISADGSAGFKGDRADFEISVGLRGADQQVRRHGQAVLSRNSMENISAVSHVARSGWVQVVAITNADRKYVDFELNIPNWANVKPSKNGAMDIVNSLGEVQGKVLPPWAVDDMGNNVPTQYEFIEGGILRQHIHPESDAKQVILDPSFWWWSATGAKCAAEIAITFTPVKLLKLTKSIASIAKKSATIKKAVDRLGGAYGAAVKLVQHSANELKARAGRWGKVIPSFKLTPQQKKDAARVAGFIGGNIWEIAGLGSCGALVKEMT